MKKLSYAFVITLLFASIGSAQTGGGYTFDNFDFANGVRIEVEPLPVSAKSRKGRKRSVTPITYTEGTNGVSMTASRSLDGFTTGDSKVDSYIVDSAARHGVDPVLIYATMHQESSFKPRAMSNKGARGLMQLMPGTAARFGVTNIWDARQNIEGGTRYMRFLLNMFDGNVALALAGYNAGEGAVMKYGYNIPPYRETQEYVRRISRRYSVMRDPETAHNARNMTQAQATAAQSGPSVPLSIYEPNVFAVRLPDGRLQLLSQ